MDGLQAKLDPDGLLPLQAGQQGNRFLRQAVRPGSDGEGADPWMGYGLGKQSFQYVYRRIRVRIRLKISNIGMGCMGLSGFGKSNLAVYLFCDGQSAACSKITGTAATAKDTAASSQRTVTIRTVHATIESNLVDLCTEGFL